MRSLFFAVALTAGAVACGAPAPQDTAVKDPKAPATEPAVVSVPLNLPRLATDSAAQSSQPSVMPLDSLARSGGLSSLYSLITATMINSDSRMLGRLYAPAAVLHTPDSTVHNGPAVVRHLITMARAKSMADFQRTSRGLRIIDDSTLVDSGSYVMVLRRSPRDSVFERGQYWATVRGGAYVGAWLVLEDRFKPGSPPKKQ